MLPQNDVRYIVAKVSFKAQDLEKTDLVFITWAPETASIKGRLLLSSSSTTLKNTLEGICKTVQANFYSDLELHNVVDRFKGRLD